MCTRVMLLWLGKWGSLWALVGLLVGCGAVEGPAPASSLVHSSEAEIKQAEELPAEPSYEIVTLLPPDAIPAIDDPQFLRAEMADEVYAAHELVLGVEINGDARAYSIPLLSSHEIVNDTVGGVPIAVTW